MSSAKNEYVKPRQYGYRSQKLYIKHVLDHREYDRGKWKEERT